MNPRVYGLSLLALLALEAVSLAAVHRPTASIALLGLSFLVAFVLGWRRPGTGLLVLLGELAVGGKGYLVYAEVAGLRTSLRIVLFSGFIVGYALRCIQRRSIPLAHLRPYRWPLAAFCATAVLAVIVPIARGGSATAVLLDANAFLYLALLIPYGELTRRDAPQFLAVVFAGATLVAIKSYVVLAWFVHGPAASLAFTYRWIRDTGVGEISPIVGSIVRVFFQSQVFGVLAALTALGWIAPRVAQHPRGTLPGALAVAVLAGGVAVSLSRSFWFGSVVGVALLPLLYPPLRKPGAALRYLGIIGGTVVLHAFLTAWALNFPWPIPRSGTSAGSLVAARVASITSEPAVSSRLEQAPVLGRAILRSPLWGYGFGASLTYTSDDPRVRAVNPSGSFTTSAFELGYLDQLLKLGLLGTVPLVALWVLVLRRLWVRRRDPTALGMLTASCALLAIHTFSPYLNHPLGIGWFLLADAVTRDGS